MSRHKRQSTNYHSDFFGQSGYFHSHCTPEEFIANCRNEIAQRDWHIKDLQSQKQDAEKHNQNIDLLKLAFAFAHWGNFVFLGLLFLSGHVIWGFLMLMGGSPFVYEVICEIEKSLMSYKYKMDTNWYDG